MSDNRAVNRQGDRGIIFSKHAAEQAEDRDVEQDEARHLIRACPWKPNEAGRFGQAGWSVQGSAGGKTVRVVFVETEDRKGIEILLVVTVIALKG